MDISWFQVFLIIVILMCVIFYVHSDVREIRHNTKEQNFKIDKLYKMWCETQKEIKQIHIDKYK